MINNLLVIINDGEKQSLKRICQKYNIKINYPELFSDENNYHLWGIFNDCIGLVGTSVMSHSKNIIRGLDELEKYLKSNQ